MQVKRLTTMALLCAIALTIFLIEAQIPAPVPIPGVKLGLANIVTVFAIYLLSARAALAILVVRVLLGSIFAGQMTMLAYSLGGGLLCLAAMVLVRRILTGKQVWICSVIGAIFHNIGQILVAMGMTGTPSIVVYLPVLILSGIVTGVFTGLCAQFLIARMGPHVHW